MENQNFMDPNFVPDEFKIPYDVIELPSQGLLYPNKKSSVKVEYLTAFDENILTSPNISNNGNVLDILINRKVKDLGFEPSKLLEGDRMAILIFLRTTSFGVDYLQPVLDPQSRMVVEGTIDLSELKQKKLIIQPNESGWFDFVLPVSGKNIKFRFLTGDDENDITIKDNEILSRNNDGISHKTTLRLERSIMDIDGNTDKMKISNLIKNLTIVDIRKLNKYITDIEPGIDFKTIAMTPGGESIETFLRINKNFFWPEL
jgi:hypothetical protein